MRGFSTYVICGALVASMGMAATTANAAASARKVPVKVQPLKADEFAKMRGQLGTCVVARNAALVTKFLANSDSLNTDFAALEVDPKRFIFAFRMDACQQYNPPQMMQYIMKPNVFRGILLEHAYLASVRSAPRPLLNEAGEPALAPARHYVSKAEDLAAATAFAQLADCTAANGTTLADAVLRTSMGMPDERQAAIALAPVIGECVPEGVDVTLTPDTIRGLAAEGMYLRYAAASPSLQAAK